MLLGAAVVTHEGVKDVRPEHAFVRRDLPLLGKRVHRLGLAFNQGIDGDGVQKALDRGVNYLFWTKLRRGEQHEVIKQALRQEREAYVLAAGAPFAYWGGSVRSGAEKMLRLFDIDYIDIYQLFWLGKMSRFSSRVQRELRRLREEGLVRAVGVSIHDRPRAARLAEGSMLDMLMLRYSAAHPGAESDVFPVYAKRRPLTVAYTATSWRRLLRRPKGWQGPVMTAGDCYRFCLSSPHVDVVLCGADSTEHLSENLDALQKGPLTAEEDEWMRRFGRAVHG